MNLDHIDRLLVDALPWLSMTLFPLLLILTAVGIAEWLRLDGEDDYSVTDYAEPAVVPDRRQLIRDALVELKRRRVTVTVVAEDILPPAPPGANAGAPLYAALTARRMLREIGAVEQAKAGIRPAYATDRRDMTGSFPVVRAAA